ncbi:MAG: 5'-methylthioadenosine/S-adenosylhomocysteine nucleosidase family protein [Solirubrobacterales bacterium]
MFDNLFLDFLNRDSRQIFGTFANFNDERHLSELTRALNAAAFLCGTYCLVPPGFLVEDELAAEALVNRRTAYLEERLVRLPLREAEFGMYWEKKEREYAGVRGNYQNLFNKEKRKLISPYVSALVNRRTKAGERIVETWTPAADTDPAWSGIAKRRPAKEIERAREIPVEVMEAGEAVTWPAIRKRLEEVAGPEATIYRPLLQHHYFDVYIHEYGLAVLRDLPFARQDFVPGHDLYNSYESLRRALGPLRLFELAVDLSAESMLRLRETRGYYDFFELYGTVVRQAETVTEVGAAFARVANRLDEPTSTALERAERRGALELHGASLEPAELDEVDERLQAAAAERDAALDRVAVLPKGALPGKERRTRVAVFVALEEESRLLREYWGLKYPFPNNAFGEVGEVDVELVTARYAGRVPAAVKMMEHLAQPVNNPDVVVVAGIAGGFVEEDVKKGDVVIADKIVDLAHRKVRVKEENIDQEFRPEEFRLDTCLGEFVESDNFDTAAWEQEVSDELTWPDDGDPTIHTGSLACVDEVVASDEWRETLRRAAPKLHGVEMEAGGVCAAAARPRIPVIVLRGISDLADPMKSDDAWREIAVGAVARLLRRAFEDPAFAKRLQR